MQVKELDYYSDINKTFGTINGERFSYFGNLGESGFKTAHLNAMSERLQSAQCCAGVLMHSSNCPVVR